MLKRELIAGLVIAAVLSIPAQAGAIYGGHWANPKAFPWYVTLTYKGREQCGGSVIAPRTVITAAHCLNGLDWRSLKVVFNYKTNPRVASITMVATHPYYHAANDLNDIAILFLDARAPLVTPITMVRTDPPVRSWLTAIGFGCSSPPYVNGSCKSWPSRLKSAPMQRPPQRCRSLSRTSFCLIEREGALNHGDSGGPVMIMNGGLWQLAGLAELVVPDIPGGEPLASPYFAMATSIAQERSWIDRTATSAEHTITPNSVREFVTQIGPLSMGIGPYPWYGHNLAPVDAIRVFGPARVLIPQPANEQGGECKLHWPQLNLTLDYWDLGGGTGPACRHTQLQSVAVGAPWETDRGLTVFDSLDQLKRIYPHAQQQNGRWLLEPYWSALVGGPASAIDAIVAGGRVIRLESWIGGAGE
jgi:leukocyte elastase